MNTDSLSERIFQDGDITVIPSLYFWRRIDDSWPVDKDVRVAIPENLIRLFELAAENSGKHVDFLAFVFTQNFRGRQANAEDWVEFSRARLRIIRALEETRRLIRITEKHVDGEVEAAFKGAFDNQRYEIEMSPRRNFLRDFFVRVISYSKQTGAKIVDKSGNFFRAAGRFIAALQIPDRIDDITEKKQRLSNRVFGFRGGKGAKFFIGVVVSAGGIYLTPVSVVGLMIAFTDP
jgi:hypothetical protein